MKILIVDDSRAMRMIVRRTLRQAGYGAHAVVEASNGNEGLELYQAEAPDIILSDWHMPEMDGLTFLDEIRKVNEQVPFGFVTSQFTPEMREKARLSGARFLIAKPFTVETFQETLRPFMQ